MQKLIELKQRMKTVRNIETISRTLATVSAAKLSRTRRRAAGLREYAKKMREALAEQQRYFARMGRSLSAFSPLLRERRRVKKVALLLITADRGMCGNYNLAAARKAMDLWERKKGSGQEVSFIVKGKKGGRYLKQKQARTIHLEGWSRAGVLPDDVERLLGLLGELYTSGQADEIHAVYTQFYSPIRRKPQTIRLLPLQLDVKETGEGKPAERWSYEPSLGEILDELLYVYLRVQLFDMLLESYASEQGARMITMEEATERSERTLKACQTMYNRLRREAITVDLISVLFASRVVEETAAAPARLA